MPTYEVKQVSDEVRPWKTKQGSENLSYTVSLLDKDTGVTAHAIEWAKKKTSRPPEVGEEVVGHIESGPYSEKLKVNYEETRALTGGTNARDLGYKKPGKWQPESERDPERSARILRQHSQEMAIRVCGPNPIGGDVHADDNSSYLGSLMSWIDWFDQDVNEAGQAAKGGAGNASSAPAPPSQPVVDLQECAEALDTAGLTSGPAQNRVADYMVFQLDPERCAKAVRNLVNAADLETQAATLKALKGNTEKHFGEPLPSPFPREDYDGIPF